MRDSAHRRRVAFGALVILAHFAAIYGIVTMRGAFDRASRPALPLTWVNLAKPQTQEPPLTAARDPVLTSPTPFTSLPPDIPILAPPVDGVANGFGGYYLPCAKPDAYMSMAERADCDTQRRALMTGKLPSRTPTEEERQLTRRLAQEKVTQNAPTTCGLSCFFGGGVESYAYPHKPGAMSQPERGVTGIIDGRSAALNRVLRPTAPRNELYVP